MQVFIVYLEVKGDTQYAIRHIVDKVFKTRKSAREYLKSFDLREYRKDVDDELTLLVGGMSPNLDVIVRPRKRFIEAVELEE